MILYIDTTDSHNVVFALKNEKTFRKTYKIDPHKSHETLGRLHEFLKLSKLKASDIKKIVVNKGPGSYTGVRVGVSLAMA
ncbi:MAG: tRNA (adenosine(37)-N6)-threonylcarbamoyltransferase complex dimerization subunit type 1 TsaB, partial [Patescibacteria group bacterium]|nr:tRNA (adenosine(37)-N6)-threonylcarbamoyltransferase complex dimerization subunit type 1 TsaB [Patescibacteria group bacterium]